MNTYLQIKSDLTNDLIIIPTCDGVLIAFTFDGLHDIHLQFAKTLLTLLNAPKAKERCQYFDEHGWCNCHDYVNLRIGVAEGKCIIYQDINGRYNVAGGVVNLASRVMNLAGRNQIVFSESAFRQLIDMVDDPKLGDRFVEIKDRIIKHGEKVTVYGYNVLPTFSYKGDLEVHEKVDGNFDVTGSLLIGERGFVVGNIAARSLKLNGKVHGSVKVGLCELCNGSELIGDLIASRLMIDEGATFLGISQIVVG